MEIKIDKKNYELIVEDKDNIKITPQQLDIIIFLKDQDHLIKIEDIAKKVFGDMEKKNLVSQVIYFLNKAFPIISSRLKLGVRLNPDFTFKIL